MKTIVILSQKGGAGKSTLSVSLALEAENNGKQTLLVDIDQQANVYKWSKRRNSKLPVTVSSQSEALEELLREVEEKGADFAIIDTAGHSSNEAIKAARLSDFVLIPSRASAFDLEAIEDSINVAALARKPAYVVFNAVPPNANRAFEEIKEVVEKQYNTPVLPFYIAQRSAFAHCMISGEAPQEYEPDGKAAQEIKMLYSYIDNLLTR